MPENNIPKSSVEKTLSDEKRRRGNWLYDPNSPEKEKAISMIVSDGFQNLKETFSREPVRKGDLSEIIHRTEKFIENRIQAGRLPTVEGWAVALGVDRSTVFRWIRDSSDYKVHSYMKVVREYFSDVAASAAISGQINPVPWIFYSKNMYEYADKTEVVLSPANPIEPPRDPEEIAKRYALGVSVDCVEDESQND